MKRVTSSAREVIPISGPGPPTTVRTPGTCDFTRFNRNNVAGQVELKSEQPTTSNLAEFKVFASTEATFE